MSAHAEAEVKGGTGGLAVVLWPSNLQIVSRKSIFNQSFISPFKPINHSILNDLS